MEFIEAVMRCPEYGSPAFEAALTEANAGVLPPLLADVGRLAAGPGVSAVEFRSVMRAIVDYLESHPDAADTVDGVVQRWLAGRECTRPAVERALSALVQRRVLGVRIEPDGSAVYAAARKSPPR